MSKHTKLFYRVIAGIRAVGEKNGVVYLDRLRLKLNIGYARAAKLKDELVEAGVLREWNKDDFGKPSKGEKGKGNIIWEGLSRYRVPKEVTEKETIRVKDERKRGLL